MFPPLDSTIAVQPAPGPPSEWSRGAGVEVSLSHVCLGYPAPWGSASIVEGFDLDLSPGECVAVVGASGCGKSTLLHALAGLLPPLEGSLSVGGGPACTARAAYMFQNDLLLPWKTVAANAAFAAKMAARSGDLASGRRGWKAAGPLSVRRRHRAVREAARVAADSLLREFGLGEALDLYPHQLSGGMRQRVALARTLALGRGLVLLDEPFGSLDALSRVDLQRWLLRVMQTHPATWVLVTHDVDEAVRLADRVIVLGGRPARIRGSVDVPLARDRRTGDDRLGERVLRRAALDVWLSLEEVRAR